MNHSKKEPITMLSKLNTLRDNHTFEGGFTLIEMIIVVVVLGVLAGVAIPVFIAQQKAALHAGMQSDVRNAHIQILTQTAKYPQAAIMYSCTYGQETGNRIHFHDNARTGIDSYIPFTASDAQTKLEVWGLGSGDYTIRAFNVDAQHVVEYSASIHDAPVSIELSGSGDYGPCAENSGHRA